MSEMQVTLLDLLLFPVALPVRGFLFVLDQIRETADREIHDPEVLRRRLLELQMLYELEEVPEEEYRTRWEELRERLEALADGGSASPEEAD